MEDLIEYGRVRRAWLGVSIEEVDQDHQDYYKLPRVAGVIVQEITGNSPAEDANLQEEDIIFSVDGTVVHTPSGLQNVIAQRRPGETVTVRVYRGRDGTPRDVGVLLGEAPLRVQEEAPPETAAAEEEEMLGIEVTELSPDLARGLGYSEPGGVVITQVARFGPAGRKRVQPGEKLLAINEQPVEATGDVKRILSNVGPGDVVSLRLGYIDGTDRVVLVRARE
jgi:serine protease Do